MKINSDFPCNKSNYRVRKQSIKYIVIHYVGAESSAKQNAKYFSTTANLNSSAHYFVGTIAENGEIYQSVQDSQCAWHCGTTGKYYSDCRNDNSIGIELCCHLKNGKWYFDSITVQNALELTKELMIKYNVPISNVLRHYDVTHKNCPAPFVESPNLWNDFIDNLRIADIIRVLANAKIISEPNKWFKKLAEDSNSYWLAKKTADYIARGGKT